MNCYNIHIVIIKGRR